MDYEKIYKDALAKARHYYLTGKRGAPMDFIKIIFPELRESEGEYVEKIKKDIILYLNNRQITSIPESNATEKWIDWIKKQKPIINKEDEEVRQYLIRTMKQNDINVPMVQRALAWLEKQGEKQQKTSIWKHWKDGITGNGESEPIYLIKYGHTYSLSSCLGFECDYIELSELDKLLSEKHGEQRPTIEMITPEESLGIDSETYNKIVDECIYGEQNPDDKVEAKFKIGDWIVDKSGLVQQVLDFRGGIYTCTYNSFTIDCESNYHLWTIQDAKDGDVLCCESGWTCIFKTLVNDETFSSYCFMDRTKSFFETGSECHMLNEEFIKAYNGEIKPATKEQRDLLFQKMEEAGYQWDTEKKELKKIEDEHETHKQEVMSEMCDLVKNYIKQPVLGEEDDDDAWMNDIISKVENNLQLNKVEIDWLKSLKEKIIK